MTILRISGFPDNIGNFQDCVMILGISGFPDNIGNFQNFVMELGIIQGFLIPLVTVDANFCDLWLVAK